MSKERDAAAVPVPVPGVEDVGKALKVVNAMRRSREKAERAEHEAVMAARAAGASWTKIGELYGLTKQGAQQRFKTPKAPTAG